MNRFQHLYRFFYKIALNTLIKPYNLITLPKYKEAFKGESYYPEKKQRSVWSAFFYQIVQILKYGYRNDYYFMYGLDVKSSKERKEYLNYAPFMARRDYLNFKSNPHNSTCILRNKLYFDVVSKEIGILTPRIWAYSSKGKLFIWKGQFVEGNVDELFDLPENSFFCKAIDGECGEGVFILSLSSDGIYKMNRDIVTKEMIGGFFCKYDYLLQERVTQHKKMSELYPNSVNTLRLVTVRNRKDNQIHVFPSILRIGANGSFVDNTSQGGIAVGVDLETGKLHHDGFFKPSFGHRVDTHPNTGIRFEDFYIPYIEKVKEDAIRFHSFLTDLHSIGWDVAIGQNGPVFIEGNDNWEINGPQVGNHGLKKEFEEFF